MAKSKLLIVDESPAVMSVTKRILERAGYIVCCAHSKTEAQAVLAEFAPDGIILGKEMTDGDGLVYCRELRNSTALPIMFFSGDKADELAALRQGATDYMKMPNDFDIMKARISIMLNCKLEERT